MLMIFRHMLKTHVKIKFHCIGRDCKENGELTMEFPKYPFKKSDLFFLFFFFELKTKIYTCIYMHDLI